MHRLGIDLGGTKIEAILLDDSLNVIHRKRVPTPKNDYDGILQSITDLVNEIKTKNQSIGICTPGAISKKSGMVKNSNTQCLIGKPLKEDLEKALCQNIAMENDANCFAMAEALLGAGKGNDIVFGVIMGTGIGGGIIINGKIHKGRTNIAGEWGHHRLHDNGNLCYCGKRGCVETYISGPALEKKWYEITGTNQKLPDIIKNIDNAKFTLWKKEFLENYGLALSNVIDILDPDVIVLGGGVSNIPFLYSEGKNFVYENVFSDLVDTPILKNTLGDSAGVFGACLLES
jgi:fructokinase